MASLPHLLSSSSASAHLAQQLQSPFVLKSTSSRLCQFLHNVSAHKKFPPLVVNCSSSSQELQKKNTSSDAQQNQSQENEKEETQIEVGWKRTKPIVFERPKGAAILAVLTRFGDVMDHPFGSVSTLAKVGSVVAEKIVEEADVLRNQDDIQELKLNELIRVVKLMEVDLKFAGAAKKEETLAQRLDEARAHCKQAIFIAKAL